MTLALSITHAAHLPERVDAFARHRPEMQELLFDSSRVESHVGPWWEWSELQWRWGAEFDHTVFIQDDSVCCPNFYDACRQLTERRPNDVIALFTPNALGMAQACAGHSAVTTPDGLVGVGYIFPGHLLREFLHWRSSALNDGVVEMLHEDLLINVWAMATGRRFFHPLPCPVDHDPKPASTWDNPTSNTAEARAVMPHNGERLLYTQEGLSRPVALRRTRVGNHSNILTSQRPEVWRESRAVERYYALAGGYDLGGP